MSASISKRNLLVRAVFAIRSSWVSSFAIEATDPLMHQLCHRSSLNWIRLWYRTQGSLGIHGMLGILKPKAVQPCQESRIENN